MALHIDYCFFLPFSASQIDSPWISRTSAKYGSHGEFQCISLSALQPRVFLKLIFSVGVLGLKITPVTPCKIWMAMMIESALSLVLVQRVNSSV